MGDDTRIECAQIVDFGGDRQWKQRLCLENHKDLRLSVLFGAVDIKDILVLGR